MEDRPNLQVNTLGWGQVVPALDHESVGSARRPPGLSSLTRWLASWAYSGPSAEASPTSVLDLLRAGGVAERRGGLLARGKSVLT
jgi:hypothetical protein